MGGGRRRDDGGDADRTHAGARGRRADEPPSARPGVRRGGVHRPEAWRQRLPERELPPSHPRYEAIDLLGHGSQGIVFRARDAELGREVALKTVRTEKMSLDAVDRFLTETAATAALEHPNIVPIYDFGRLDDGRPFYTMRLVSGRTFASVLSDLRDANLGDGDLRNADLRDGKDGEWGLVRLLQVLQQACLALQFAHERGVIHRDVKPSNVLVGSFGEILLVDWGISKVPLAGGRETTLGTVQGTPHYMSPEQARAERVDARTDVYSMGVVLYEALSLRLPHDEQISGAELIAAILRDAPLPPERRTRRPVPPELSALVQRAMAKSREERIATARELHDELQAFLEGAADRARRAREAERLTSDGEELLRRRAATELHLEAARTRVAQLQQDHPTWQPIPDKRPLLEQRRRVEELEGRSRTELLQAVHRLTDALALLPDHARARALLADTFLQRLREAETTRDEAMGEVWLSLVERFHDGRHARELSGHGSVRVTLEPRDATWSLRRLVESDVALIDGPEVGHGRGDVSLDDLPMGSYVLAASAPDRHSARYPIAIFRNTEWIGELRLPPRGVVPDGFVFVPGTETWLGGDPLAINSWPLRRVRVESFAMARHPVTFQDWCAWLDELGPDEAPHRIPRTESMGPLCELRDGRHAPEAFARGLAPWTKERHGDDCAWRVPVMGVTVADAEEYCEHLSRRLERRVRLPTPEEWELAARGVDRRVYPWGNRFDATACHCRESSPRQPDMAPVGAAELDESPYGVRDMAGGVHEMTSCGTDQQLVEVRGGMWMSAGAHLRSAARNFGTRGSRTAQLGFRVVADVPEARDAVARDASRS